MRYTSCAYSRRNSIIIAGVFATVCECRSFAGATFASFCYILKSQFAFRDERELVRADRAFHVGSVGPLG
jgi:hypothetical protein